MRLRHSDKQFLGVITHTHCCRLAAAAVAVLAVRAAAEEPAPEHECAHVCEGARASAAHHVGLWLRQTSLNASEVKTKRTRDQVTRVMASGTGAR